MKKLAMLVGLFGLLVIAVATPGRPVQAQLPGFSAPVNLTNNGSGSSFGAALATSGLDVYAAWYKGGVITFYRSTDGGVSFAGGGSWDARNSRLAVSGSNIHLLLWVTGAEFTYVRSTDKGETFETSFSGGGSVGFADIAAVGSHVYIIWVESGGGAVQFSASHDGGATFGPGASFGASCNAPSVAASRKNVYVAWIECGSAAVLAVTSKDRGETFSGASTLISDGIGQNAVSAGAGGGRGYVAWSGGSGFDPHHVGFSGTAEDGVTFGSPIILHPPEGFAFQTSVAASGPNVTVAWRFSEIGFGAPLPNVFVARSEDGGESFGSAVDMSGPSDFLHVSDVAAWDDRAYVAWSKKSGPAILDVFLAGAGADGPLPAAVDSVEFTQAIQEWQPLEDLMADLAADGAPPVPMVAGKPAVMRVYLSEVEKNTRRGVEVTGTANGFMDVDVMPGCSPSDQRRQEEGCLSTDFYFTPPSGAWSVTLTVFDGDGREFQSFQFDLVSVDTIPLEIVPVPVCDTQDGGGCTSAA